MGYSRAVSSWFTDRRGMALALVVAGVGVGSMVFPWLAQRMIDAHGWRARLSGAGRHRARYGNAADRAFCSGASRRSTAGQPLLMASRCGTGCGSRAFWLLVAMFFLSSIAVNGAITHLSPLLTDRGSAGERCAGRLCLGAASLFGRLVTGHLLDRFFGPWVSFVLLVGVAAGILLLATASPWRRRIARRRL